MLIQVNLFLIGKTGTGKSESLKILYGDTPINSELEIF